MTGTQSVKPALMLAASFGLFSSASAATFDFAGYSWDQDDTPDTYAALASATYDGAIVTSQPTTRTSSSGVGFPNAPTTGFDTSLTTGQLAFGDTGVARALNLPSGNDGTAARSGFTLSWSSGPGVTNLAGDDFVVFESASNISSPEGFMVQVRSTVGGTYSSWRYEQPDSFSLYVGDATQGAFAHAFDLTDFGLAVSATIDEIRIVNLTNEDRMVSSSGVGTVIPDDNGTTSSNLPNPGPFAGSSMFGGGSLDPDPIYVTGNAIAIPEPALLTLVGVGGLALSRRWHLA